MQAANSREKTRRPISEKVKLGMKSQLSKADSFFVSDNKKTPGSLSYIRSMGLLFFYYIVSFSDFI